MDWQPSWGSSCHRDFREEQAAEDTGFELCAVTEGWAKGVVSWQEEGRFPWERKRFGMGNKDAKQVAWVDATGVVAEEDADVVAAVVVVVGAAAVVAEDAEATAEEVAEMETCCAT